jgi:hypothetical protein
LPPNDPSEIIIQVTCMRMRGPLGVAGLLTLSSNTLLFEPTGRLDRIIGERPLSIQTDSINKVILGGIERTLTVYSTKKGGLEHKFAGRGAARMHLRLESMLAQRLGDTALLPSGEKPLIEGTATLYNNNLIATRGDLLLTRRRFFFTPRGGLETHIWSFPEINVSLNQITQIQLSEVRKILEIWINDEKHLFGGPIVVELHECLCSIGLDLKKPKTAIPEPVEVDIEIKASAHQGLIPTAGSLLVTKSEITFGPKSRLGTMMGASTQTVMISDIEKMEAIGNKKLIITSCDDTMTLSLSEPKTEILNLIPRIISCLNRELQDLEAESGGFEQLLSTWKSELQLTLGEPIVLTAPAISWQDENTAVCGWLALTDARVFFLPLAGPERDDGLISIDLTTIIPNLELKERSKSEVYIETHKTEFHFTPLTATGFVEAFWILSEPIITEEVSLPDHFERARSSKIFRGNVLNDPSGQGDQLADLEESSPSLGRLVGDLSSMTIHRGDQPILHLVPAVASVHAEGVSVTIDASTCVWFEEGEPLSINFVRVEGTYSFHSTVMAIQKDIQSEKEDGPSKNTLLIRKPRSIKFIDRRLVPRASFPPLSRKCTVDVTGLPGFSENKIRGHIRNLSIEGCSIQLNSFIPENLAVILTVKLGDSTASLSAVCHHTTPPHSLDGSWFFGLKFTNNSQEDSEAINNAIAANTQR